MENFVVSARKYRPQTFATVVGQGHITTTLKNAILQQHLAHAFLFCGPRGVGKTTCARILAKTINCENLQKNGEACDQCSACVSFNTGASFNVHELDAASNNSVDDIRELTEQMRFAPQAGRYKVYIIDEVHMLSPSAFNAFLKTLEEPPAHAIFILATTEKHKIIPTILSRCQIFDFKRITASDIVEHLEEIVEKEMIKAAPGALQVIAQKSDGCMRDALSILDKIVSFTNANLTYSNTLEHLNLLDEDYFFKLLELLQEEDLAGVLTLYDEIDKKGFEGDALLNNLAEFFRNLLVSRDPRSTGLLQVVEEFRSKYLETASSISPAYMIAALHVLNEAELGYKQARNKKLHVEFHLIRLTHLKQAVNLVAEDGLGKKKRLDDIKPVSFRAIGFTAQQTAVVPKNAKLVVEGTAIAPKQQIFSGTHTGTPTEKHVNSAAQGVTAASTAVVINTIPESSTGGLGALKKIREQIQNRKLEQVVVHTLSEESLQKSWQSYLDKLKENNQVTSHANLRMASIRIVDAHHFEIMAHTRIQQQLVEAEKSGLLVFMQEEFNNPKVQFKIALDPAAEKEAQIVDQPLSQKEQYLRMASLYPIVAELRDQLNLDLDY